VTLCGDYDLPPGNVAGQPPSSLRLSGGLLPSSPGTSPRSHLASGIFTASASILGRVSKRSSKHNLESRLISCQMSASRSSFSLALLEDASSSYQSILLGSLCKPHWEVMRLNLGRFKSLIRFSASRWHPIMLVFIFVSFDLSLVIL
jgi:hypothetical protein